jgi:hypothetical protein
VTHAYAARAEASMLEQHDRRAARAEVLGGVGRRAPDREGVRAGLLLLLVALVVASSAMACQGAALKYIRFPVSENGCSVVTIRFFMEGIAEDDPQTRAFERAQLGDPRGGITILSTHLARHPGDAWSHYDLGLLYEATDAWSEAELELKEARRDNPHEPRFREELAFIARHKGK